MFVCFSFIDVKNLKRALDIRPIHIRVCVCVCVSMFMCFLMSLFACIHCLFVIESVYCSCMRALLSEKQTSTDKYKFVLAMK